MFTVKELEAAAELVHRNMLPTPTHAWPLLAEALGADVYVKHENHAPTGAFKVRGGITFVDWLKRAHPDMRGIVTATRGNHGQSQARAASAVGLTAKIFAPVGNSQEKNAAMRAYGGEVITHGSDFDEARGEAIRVGQAEGLFLVPPFHRDLVRGVATYGYEMFLAQPDLDVIYVPIGCGSGICGVIAARDALGAKAEVVGVVAEGAQCAKLSFESGELRETNEARSFADGMAVRVPVQAAFDIYHEGAARIDVVTDAQIAQAARLFYSATHNVAEGAGAAALAAATQDVERNKGRKVGVILSGGNIDADAYASLLQGNTPLA